MTERLLIHQDRIKSFGVNKLGFFGSFARNQANEGSDVDFFIEISRSHKTLKNFLALSDFLEKITGRKAEIITPQSLSKYLGPHILKEVEYVSFIA